MSWREETESLVSDCVGAFAEASQVTLRRDVPGTLNTTTQTVEADPYSLTLTVMRSRLSQGMSSRYGTEDTVYRGKVADLTEGLGPDPQLAAGMWVEDDNDGSEVRRRVVRVGIEAAGAGFALFCVTDRSPSE